MYIVYYMYEYHNVIINSYLYNDIYYINGILPIGHRLYSAISGMANF